MSPRDSAATDLESPPVETPIFTGEGYEVFEGWGGLTPAQLAECEQAEADLVSGSVKGISGADVRRHLAEMRAQHGG